MDLRTGTNLFSLALPRSVLVLSTCLILPPVIKAELSAPPHSATQSGKRWALKPREPRVCILALGTLLTYFFIYENWHEKLYHVGLL